MKDLSVQKEIDAIKQEVELLREALQNIVRHLDKMLKR